MSTPLFRPEVMQAQAGQWLGAIRIGRPLSFALAATAALLMAAGLVGFAVWGEYTRKVTLPGVLVPEGGVMDVSSPQAGAVVELLVREGQAVQAGQPLLRLRADRQTAGGELGALQAAAIAQRRQSLQTELRLLEQQAQQRAAGLAERLRSLQAEAVHLQGELEAVQRRIQLAGRTAKNFEDLAAQGFVPQLQAQQKLEELLDLGQRERNARRQLEAGQREGAGVQAELALARTQADSGREQIQRQLVALGQEGSELDARSQWTLNAPRAGRVSSLNTVAGQAVVPGLTLVSLLPADAAGGAKLVAQLFAPSRMAGFIEPGQPVWMRYAAYPYQKFGMQRGEVVAVSRSPINPQDLPSGRSQALQQAVQSTEPLYRIQVRLARQDIAAYGASQPLKAGMALESQVRQEGRAIWEWVLAPLHSLAP